MTIEVEKRGNLWSPWRVAGWSLAVMLLALPAIAMRFTTEVDWSPGDFVFMGGLMASIGLGIEFLVRQSDSAAYRFGAAVALITVFLTIWVNLAVGMIGDDNPYNLLFGGVLLVALAGAILARFEAAGMMKAMLMAAAAQAAVGIGGMAMAPRDGLFSTGFALFWLLAAALFASARGRSAHAA